MKIALIGGTGFIGEAVAREARNRGHQVLVAHRGKHPCSLEGVQDELVDRSQTQSLQLIFQKFKPDVIIETHAMTKEDAQSTIRAVEGIRASLLVLSSHDVYAQFGSLHGHPLPQVEDEVTEEAPLTVPYPFRGILHHDGGEMYDKKDVEAAFQEAASTNRLSNVTILRLPATYGTGDPQRRFAAIIEQLQAGNTEIPQDGGANWRWTHGHVIDVAYAVVLAAEAQINGYCVMNVGEETPLTMREWVEAIAKEMKREISWKKVDQLPSSLFFLGTMPNDVVVSTKKIRQLLGYNEKTTTQERIVDLINYTINSSDS